MQSFSQFELRKLGVTMENFIRYGELVCEAPGRNGSKRRRVGVDGVEHGYQIFFGAFFG